MPLVRMVEVREKVTRVIQIRLFDLHCCLLKPRCMLVTSGYSSYNTFLCQGLVPSGI